MAVGGAAAACGAVGGSGAVRDAAGVGVAVWRSRCQCGRAWHSRGCLSHVRRNRCCRGGLVGRCGGRTCRGESGPDGGNRGTRL
jgi:hypothetical protein